MSALWKQFKNEFQVEKLYLQCEDPEDFYLSPWQKSSSAVPLLLWRIVLFLACLGILVASLTINIQNDYIAYWFIYMTFWCITLNTILTGSAVCISLYVYRRGPLTASSVLPLYLRIFWVFYNICTSAAFLVTVYYWSLVYEVELDQDGNPVPFTDTMDFMVHGMNSILMLLLVLSSKIESRVLHVTHPLSFYVIYNSFSAIYYVAGGTNGYGGTALYPLLDWSDPGWTFLNVVLTAGLMILLHFTIVAIAAGRDALANYIHK